MIFNEKIKAIVLNIGVRIGLQASLTILSDSFKNQCTRRFESFPERLEKLILSRVKSD